MCRTLTVSQASRAFSDLINRVRYQGESAVLAKNGKPVAKIIPVDQNITGKDLAGSWPSLSHLTAEEAHRFETDLSEARSALPSVKDKWE